MGINAQIASLRQQLAARDEEMRELRQRFAGTVAALDLMDHVAAQAQVLLTIIETAHRNGKLSRTTLLALNDSCALLKRALEAGDA